MKVIDSTIFCNEYEKELLLLKFILESPCVDEWVITECQYDYRGVYKGAIVEKMMAEDSRFAPYLDRVTVFSINKNLSNPDPSLLRQIDPPDFANAEFRLRDWPTNYLLSKYSAADRVLPTDVDEAFDFTCPRRRDTILKLFRGDRPLQFDRVRYIYDFHNRAWRDRWDMVNPAYRVEHIRGGVAHLHQKKWNGDKVGPSEDPLVFEYSFCFPREAIHKKYGSSLHTLWTRNKIEDSLDCNHWGLTAYQEVSFQNRWQWFEFVELTESNSPRFVRDNLSSLMTKVVPDDYSERRLARYNFVACFPENVG